jgi:CheY-like chemotaxis protein
MGHYFPKSKGVILVVEDEPLLRLLAVDFMEEDGFEVVDVGSADEAVSILETRSDIRIVFTDIDMPGSMDGMKLAAAVRDRWPPVEIVVVSGHKRQNDIVLPERAVFFPKPYNIEAVTATLNRMASAI